MPFAKFTASVSFLGAEEGGRKHPVIQGYRPSLYFSSDNSSFGMVVLFFFDNEGKQLEHHLPVPRDAVAEFRIANDWVHSQLRQRLSLGTTFELREGHRTVARARVTSLEGL
ncbi:MAG: hypothetical protein WA814_10090 [Candidatus Baltobacteraceae bacterium]